MQASGDAAVASRWRDRWLTRCILLAAFAVAVGASAAEAPAHPGWGRKQGEAHDLVDAADGADGDAADPRTGVCQRGASHFYPCQSGVFCFAGSWFSRTDYFLKRQVHITAPAS
jgi:hypothetical protein